jgi:hypothetical protein
MRYVASMPGNKVLEPCVANFATSVLPVILASKMPIGAVNDTNGTGPNALSMEVPQHGMLEE